MESSTMPAWLDKQFIEASLRETFKSPLLSVDRISVKNAVASGENFASQLHRVTAYITDSSSSGTRHYVVKSLPVDGIVQVIVTECLTFETETKIYTTTLPSLHQILSEKFDNMKTWYPQSFNTSRPHTLIMNDLKEDGFKMADRRGGLDYDHCALALRAVARMHAASLVYYKRNPDLIHEYDERFYTAEKRDMVAAVYDPMFTALPLQIEKWPGYEHYADKVRNTLTTDKLINFMTPKADETFVLNHGDLWINNIMFRYDNNQVVDVKFVDFQETKYTSPTIDLQCFFATSLDDKVREERWGDLLNTYYSEFRNVLERFEVDISELKDIGTFEKFRLKMEEKHLYGLMSAGTVLALALAEPNAVADFNQISMEGNGKKQEDSSEFEPLYSSSKFREVYQKLLKYFEKAGVFND